MHSDILSAQALGGAVLVHKGGTIGLSEVVFEANVANGTENGTDDSVGIVNVGGQVRCISSGCFPVCTACRGDDGDNDDAPLRADLDDNVHAVDFAMAPSISPTPRTGSKVGVVTAKHWTTTTNGRVRIFTLAVGCIVCLVLLCVLTTRLQRAVVGSMLASTDQRPLIETQLDVKESLELVHLERSVMTAYETSPAAIFVVGQDELRIKLWSPGMLAAAPLLFDPEGMRLTDLPFVNSRDADRLSDLLEKMFEAPADTNNATMMMYLRTRKGNVLLEMIANNAIQTDSDSIIVVTGRAVENDLASLMMAAGSEREAIEEDYFGSVSDVRSRKGEIGLPTSCETGCSTGSSVSSLTIPSAFGGLKLRESCCRTPARVFYPPIAAADLRLNLSHLLGKCKNDAVSRSDDVGADESTAQVHLYITTQVQATDGRRSMNDTAGGPASNDTS